MSHAIPSLPPPIGSPPPHGPQCPARTFVIGKPPKPFDDIRNDLSSNGLLHSQELNMTAGDYSEFSIYLYMCIVYDDWWPIQDSSGLP